MYAGSLRTEIAEVTSYENPHGFQVELARRVLEGRNVVLRAPTGSGKTVAALAPFLVAHKQGAIFPSRAIYSLPLRTLAKSLKLQVEELPYVKAQGIDVALQTGEDRGDPHFVGDIVFCTIDQSLSSFLCIPFAVGAGQANINAAAIASSYLVFDEVHLLDPELSLRTTYVMLKMLKGISRWVLMTATLSKHMIHGLCKELDADYLEPSPAEVAEIPSQASKDRRFRAEPHPISAGQILERHAHSTIVICNTVDRAQELFLDLEKQMAERGRKFEPVLLHSRFTGADRAGKEQRIRELFGRHRTAGADAILVATQVVEVGLDISCEALHTETAPLNSLLQRAGRCARFEGESGVVYVYPVPPLSDGRPDYGPYVAQSDLCNETYKAISGLPNKPVDYQGEMDLIERLLSPLEQMAFDSMHGNEFETAKLILDTMSDNEKGRARELIRSVDTRQVAIHPCPERQTRPYWLETFSLRKQRLLAMLDQYKKEGGGAGSWFAKYPLERERQGDDGLFAGFDWREVTEEHGILFNSFLVLNPRYASYDPRVGLQLMRQGSYQSRALETSREVTKRSYKRETYAEHVVRTLRAYRDVHASRLAYLGHRLEHCIGIGPEGFNRLAMLCIACHDVAKLSCEWQRPVLAWQASDKGRPEPEGVFLAHSDYDEDADRDKAKAKEYHRPPHAVESACLAAEVVVQVLKNMGIDGPGMRPVAVAVLSAIARHHSPKTKTVGRLRLKNGAHAQVEVTLELALGRKPSKEEVEGLGDRIKDSDLGFGAVLGSFEGILGGVRLDVGLLLYLSLVRALRLSDQGSFDYGK